MLNYKPPGSTSLFLKLEIEAINELDPEALYLYVMLRRLGPMESNDNKSLMTKTGLTEWKFKQAKNELIDKGFLDTKQLYDNRYAFYISKEIVTVYRNSYKKSYNRHEKNQLKKINKESL